MTEITTRVIEIIREKFGETGELSPDESFIENGMLKSMQVIELLLTLEDEYDVEFDFNMLDISEVESASKIKSFIAAVE